MSDINQIKTEERIKDVARNIFFSEGRFNATTQDIADAAGVNRTLINYYFRSRDTLFELVFNEARAQYKQSIESAISLKLPFREKIEKLVDALLDQMESTPYRELFILTQINQGKRETLQLKKADTKSWNAFLNEIKSEMKEGRIIKMNPVNYVLNIFSMCIFPALTKNMYHHLLPISDETYITILNERKKNILDCITLTYIQTK